MNCTFDNRFHVGADAVGFIEAEARLDPACRLAANYAARHAVTAFVYDVCTKRHRKVTPDGQWSWVTADAQTQSHQGRNA